MNYYNLFILGVPTQDQISDLRQNVQEVISGFGLTIGNEVQVTQLGAGQALSSSIATVGVYFGGDSAALGRAEELLNAGIPVVTVVPEGQSVATSIPRELQFINALRISTPKSRRVAITSLECLALLPRQRRVFISYRRGEGTAIALQLFEALSARQCDVFLDTHRVGAAEDFQAVLWHRLCDSDVLIMIDSPSYFNGRWTSAEFGRALAKSISVLRVGLPGVEASPRIGTARRVDLSTIDIDRSTGKASSEKIAEICDLFELARSTSHAVRSRNLHFHIRHSLETVGGSVIGVSPPGIMHAKLGSGREFMIHSVVGVPTSESLHSANAFNPGISTAVVYDHVGIGTQWLEHLDWLGQHIQVARWVKASNAAWDFADWHQ